MSATKRSPALLACGLLLALSAPVAAPALRAQPRGASADAPARARLPASFYTNPVLDEDFPDPTVVRGADGFYYAYATQGPVAGRGVANIQVARSRDLAAWEHLGDALPQKPAWADRTQKFWAPHVSLHDGTYYLYYSADPNTLTGLCLAVATSKNPAGPFADKGEPLKCGESFVNIDPMAFDDPRTGKRLLYWGSGFQAIRVQELAADRVSFAPGSQLVELVKPDKSAPFQTLVEGAWVVYRGGYYYLFYSGENCCHGPLQEIKYAVLVARSRSATGPFETLARAAGRPDSAILRRNDQWLAPGHNSVVTDARGRDWIAYHAIDVRRPHLAAEISGDRAVRRVFLLDPLEWRDGWPRVAGGTPSKAARRRPAAR
ncbi:MAG: glycoside hydrolase family 43 protein [Acidobacteria bacterium]|nr:glycoside hydrolase family 43 protein [Acidobacteriota bacterium]